MKKTLAFILAIIMCVIPLTASAESSLPVMGDVNGDGKISASDAREILRHSAKLPANGDFSMLKADTDANGKITASDARAVLRYSAKLSSFSCGFDIDGMPNALKLIKDRHFVMDATVKDGKDTTNLTIAINGNDVCILYNDNMPAINDAGSMGNFGIVVIDGQIYCICEIEDSKIAFAVPEDMMETLFDDDFTVQDIENLIYMAIPDALGAPVVSDKNGVTTYTYSYTKNGEAFTLTADSYGIPKAIVSANYSSAIGLEIKSISATNVESYFDLSDYIVL